MGRGRRRMVGAVVKGAQRRKAVRKGGWVSFSAPRMLKGQRGQDSIGLVG